MLGRSRSINNRIRGNPARIFSSSASSPHWSHVGVLSLPILLFISRRRIADSYVEFHIQIDWRLPLRGDDLVDQPSRSCRCCRSVVNEMNDPIIARKRNGVNTLSDERCSFFVVEKITRFSREVELSRSASTSDHSGRRYVPVQAPKARI